MNKIIKPFFYSLLLGSAVSLHVHATASDNIIAYEDFFELDHMNYAQDTRLISTYWGNSAIKMYGYQQRFGRDQSSPYLYGTENYSSLSLESNSYYYDFEPNTLYSVELLVWVTGDEPELLVRNLSSTGSFGTLVMGAEQLSNEKKNVTFNLKGSQLAAGMVIENYHVAIDDISVREYVEPDTQYDAFTFDFETFSNGYAHGEVISRQLIDNGATLSISDFHVGQGWNANQNHASTFLFNGTSESALVLQTSSLDESTAYTLAFDIGATTSKAKNIDAIQFALLLPETNDPLLLPETNDPLLLLDFESLTGFKHGEYLFAKETINGFNIRLDQQRFGSGNFIYGSDGSLNIESDQLDPAGQYALSFDIASSTSNVNNKSKVNFSVISNDDGKAHFSRAEQEVFGQPTTTYSVVLSGQDLFDGITLNNHYVTVDNVTITPVSNATESFADLTGIDLFRNNARTYSTTVTGAQLNAGVQFVGQYVTLDNIRVYDPLHVAAEKQKLAKEKVIFSVGVGDSNQDGSFAGYRDLPQSANDAVGMADLFVNDGGYSKFNAIDVNNTQFKANLVSAIENTKDAGTFVFYYSGHGSDDGFISLTQGQLSMSEVKSILDLHQGPKVVILESCGSGINMPLFSNDPSYSLLTATEAFEYSWASADSVLESSDYAAAHYIVNDLDGRYYQGHMAGAILNGVNFFASNAAELETPMDLNNDGGVTLSEIHQFVYDDLSDPRRSNSAQHPMLFLGGDDPLLFNVNN